MRIRAYEADDEGAVVALWQACELVVPHNNPVADIQRKSAAGAEMFLVGVKEGQVMASVMVGYEGHRGWINYLAVAPGHQGKGYGRQMMVAAEGLLRARGCPKINLQIRASNQGVIEFYRQLGFAVDTVVSMGKRLVVDEPLSGG
jgi:ribosomal protein S18 acetylase RimI-like enzyme